MDQHAIKYRGIIDRQRFALVPPEKKEASQKQILELAGEIVFNCFEVCGKAIPLQGKSPITKDSCFYDASYVINERDD